MAGQAAPAPDAPQWEPVDAEDLGAALVDVVGAGRLRRIGSRSKFLSS